VFVQGVKVLEGWNDNLKKSSSYGANFNNSIMEMRSVAAGLYLDMDGLSQLIAKRSKDFAMLGRGVTEGAREVSDFSREVYKGSGGVGERMLNLGRTVDQLADNMTSWYTMVNRGVRDNRIQGPAAAQAFESYMKNIMLISRMTGESVEDLQAKAEKESQNAAFQLKLNSLAPEARNRIMQQMTYFQSMYGETGAELFRALYLGVAPQTDAAQLLMTLNPQLVAEARRGQALAKSGLDEEEYGKRMRRSRAESLFQSARLGKANDALYSMIASGAPGMKEIGQSTEALNRTTLKIANMKSVDEIEGFLLQLENQNKEGDPLTRILNAFGLSAHDFQTKVIDVLLPILEGIGSELIKAGVADKMKEMGTTLGRWVGEYLPDAVGFFEELTDANGWKRWNVKIESWFSTITAYLRYAIRKAFESPEADNQLKQELEEVLKQKERDLAAIPKPATPIADAARRGYAAALETQRREAREAAAGGGAPIPGGPGPAPQGYTYGPQENMTDGSNGRLPDSALASIGQGRHRLQPSAARAFIAMADAARREGINLNVTDSYRTFAEQVDVKNRKPTLAARPGFSKHGWGLATDINVRDPKVFDWLKRNATRFGWEGPLQQPYEPWHWQFKGMSTGTLGTMGKLFGEFGAGTPVELHGREAVITPSQMEDIISTGGKVNVGEMINDLNSKMNTLISIYKEKIDINKSHLETLRHQSGNMIYA
jgi:D-alanyl-D-alanine dipeptidase